uniref:SWIM-type domain-containing protein n=1 Tax=Tanacetum cinerariifolium TaxID=118510 RepID=A0A6L2NNK1_TANCI|nr:hypothetical protein CTI12_AA091940 [Tanacetum cinerariifolium]
MQTIKEKVDTSKALDASLVDAESSETESKEHDTNSRSGNDAHDDDADIIPIYDEELMAKVQTTAEINVSAIGQQHTEQPQFNNKGEVDQNAKECHDTCPLADILTVTTHYLPKEREAASAKPHHMIASSNSRIRSKNMPRFSSNDMVYNHYLEEAKKKIQESSRNSEPNLMPSAKSQSTVNGSKPKPRSNNQNSRNWPTSKSSCVTTKIVPIAEHPRNSKIFSNSKHFVCSTCQKCVFNANHDSCVTKFLKEVNSCAKLSSNKTTNRNKPAKQTSFAKKPKRHIPKGHRWKPTGKIFKTVGLRWVPTGKIFTSSTTKVDSDPLNGSNADITNQYECKQTLDVSACTLNLRAGTSFNPNKEGLRVWLLKRMISPKPGLQGILICKQDSNIMTRVGITIPPSHNNAEGIMPTKIELTLEQSQQGVSNDVLMEEMKQLNSEAYDYLIGRDPNSLSSAFFNLIVKCPAFENEICESYHRAILLQRHKPIITMLEDIRVYLMQRVVAMHNIAVNLEDQITPTVSKKLEYLKREQRHWTVFPSAYQLLEVRCGDSAFGLNLGEKTCACRLWQLSGIPCIHAVAGYMHLNRDPDEGALDTTRLAVTKNQFLKLPFKENHQAEQGSLYMELMHQQEVVAGVLEVEEVLEVVEMVLEEVLEVDMLIESTDEDKRVQEEGEYQEKLDEDAFKEAMEQQQMNEQMDEERERQNIEEREWQETNDYFNLSKWIEDESIDVDAYNRKNSSINFNAFTQESVINDPSHPTHSTEVQVGDADVAVSAQDKNKGKAIQEGSNSKSPATPVRKSKWLRQEEPQPFRIYVKNRGRSERIAKLQGKNFKFDAQGTSSTPDKAFDVSESE